MTMEEWREFIRKTQTKSNLFIDEIMKGVI